MKYEIIMNYIDDYKTASSSEEVRFNCPFCNDSRKRMYVNLETGKFYCHNCQSQGRNPKGLIAKLTGLSLLEVSDEFKDILSEDIGSKENLSERIYEKLEIKEDFHITKIGISLPSGYKPMKLSTKLPKEKKAIRYLLGRGVTKKQIIENKMGLCKDPRYHNRVIIPITNIEGKVVFFVARDFVGKSALKEISPASEGRENTKSEILFNLKGAIDTRTMIISEGIFDALSWGRSGVALIGKIASDSHLEQFYNCRDKIEEVYVALDDDAYEFSVDLARKLKDMGYKTVKIVKMVGDPNDNLKHGKKHMRELILNAKEYTKLSILNIT